MNSPDQVDIAMQIALIIAATCVALLAGWCASEALSWAHRSWERHMQRLWCWVPQSVARPARRLPPDADDLEYENSTEAPKVAGCFEGLPPARGGSLLEIRARELAGIPAWQLKQLLNLQDTDIRGIADYAQWQRRLRDVMDRLLQAEALLQRKRAQFVIDGRDEDLPGFLKRQAD